MEELVQLSDAARRVGIRYERAHYDAKRCRYPTRRVGRSILLNEQSFRAMRAFYSRPLPKRFPDGT